MSSAGQPGRGEESSYCTLRSASVQRRFPPICSRRPHERVDNGHVRHRILQRNGDRSLAANRAAESLCLQHELIDRWKFDDLRARAAENDTDQNPKCAGEITEVRGEHGAYERTGAGLTPLVDAGGQELLVTFTETVRPQPQS